MSGLCGWFSQDPAALPIGQMAAPLGRFERGPLRSAANRAGAVAVAGGLDCVQLYHQDGLLIAMWGGRADALARLWRSHGPKACAALAGQFAFALVDERKGEALLALDRAGSRPLYYQLAGRTLLFASSADALAAHPGARREVSPQALYDYLGFHCVPGPATIYQDMRRLLPGEFLHMRGGRLERGRYWQLQFDESGAQPAAALKDDFADALRAAVQASLGQQPVGVLLGADPGGAALASMLGALAGKPVRTYSVGCGAAGQRELEQARRVARSLGSEHHECQLGADEVADAIPHLAAAFDQPCGDWRALAGFYGARMARADGVERLLCGAGGAQLFGCGERYARLARLGRYERIPSALRQLLVEPLLFGLARARDAGALRAARGYIAQALAPLPERLGRERLLEHYGGASVLDADLLAAVDPGAPQAAMSQHYWLAQARTELNRLTALDMKYALADSAIPRTLRSCEAAGVELRLPFLDDGLVAFAARLQPRHKLGGLLRRGFLAQQCGAAALPRAAAPAHSGLSLAHWMHTDPRLKSLAFDSLAALKLRRIVRADFIDRLLADPAPGHRHGAMVWTLVMLEQWFAQRKQAGSSVPPSPTRTEHETQNCRQ